MATYKKKPDFLETDEGIEFVEMLNKMTVDESYYTEPSFSANSELYPNNLIPFIDKHLAYLRNHPATNPEHYLSNLKLMTRVRR